MKTLCLCLLMKDSLTMFWGMGGVLAPHPAKASSAGTWQHRKPSGCTSPGTLLRASPALQGRSRMGKDE